MNDFDYENLQKKRLARNAYAKKGSRSKKCTLPDDYLTPAQRAKLSKENVSVNLKAPMTAKEFKLLPTDVKREYLEWLKDEFNANATMIGADLFQKSRAWLSWYLNRFEPSLLGMFTKSCPRLTQEQRAKWEAWLSGEAKPADEEPTPETEPEEPEQPITDDRTSEFFIPPQVNIATEPPAMTRITGGSFTVTGPARDALATLLNLFKDDTREGTFTITFNYKEETAT